LQLDVPFLRVLHANRVGTSGKALIDVTSHRGFTISVRPDRQGSVATIARESGQPIVLDGKTHLTINLEPVRSNEAAVHDATIMIDRILRGWHRKTKA
jgi:hypothetical protein